MKKVFMAALILFLATNIRCVCAGEYTFSGYGAADESRMCTVSFSVDELSSEVVVTFRFMNTGMAPIKGDPFSSLKVEIVSTDGKTHAVTCYSDEGTSEDDSVQAIKPGDAVEKVLFNNDPAIQTIIMSKRIDHVIFYSDMGKFVLRQRQ
ncbi:MAG: hypothetical protein PHV97_06380 [Candidatus Omnitrophica bacterium]|nr:hypothetical protein [Candidatus Omnitrophota bacterium]